MPRVSQSAPPFHQTFGANLHGTDYVVGDIHGAFDKLRCHLDALSFDPGRDRLFSVGDLVDRNPGSPEALHWLSLPFFHAVRGNHENMYLQWREDRSFETDYFREWNGGLWVRDVDESVHQALEAAIRQLPYVLSVPLTDGAWVGVVHADLPHMPVPLQKNRRGGTLTRQHLADETVVIDQTLEDEVTWNRNRLQDARDGNGLPVHRIEGYDVVVVGHTTLPEAMVLDRFVYLDSGGWLEGRPFSVHTLQALVAASQKAGTTPDKAVNLSALLEA